MRRSETTRRELLGHMTGAATLPFALGSTRSAGAKVSSDTALPVSRSAFSLREGLTHLNVANLAPTWNSATATIARTTRSVMSDPSFENRLAIAPAVEKVRLKVADFLNATADEIALVRNASEANCTIANGLDLGPGDEVVVWDQNHESNDLAWAVSAQRRGFKVVKVTTPPQPQSAQDMLRPFYDVFSERTKIVAFSQISNISGAAIPTAELCIAARRRGIMSLVDGAQSCGVVAVDLAAIGCDFFTASAHKWLCGPHETGILYVRHECLTRVWPSIVTHGWREVPPDTARKLDCLGQRHDGRVEGVGTAIAEHQMLGMGRIEAHVRQMVAELRERLMATDRVTGFSTPAPVEINAGILVFDLERLPVDYIIRHFYLNHGISARVIPNGAGASVRFCPHIYSSMDDIERAVAAVRSL